MTNYEIAHIEVPAIDTAEAGQFYSDVFGWKIETNLAHNYVTFVSAGGFRGGFTDPKEPTYKPDRLLVYLATDDLDASLADIESHGGKTILPKTEIPHVGEWAVFADPAGNHIGLFLSKRQ